MIMWIYTNNILLKKLTIFYYKQIQKNSNQQVDKRRKFQVKANDERIKKKRPHLQKKL